MSGLEIKFPTFGWRQILTARKEILDRYDHARDQSRVRRVRTLHGNVAEGAVRAWLSKFLPERYGVTSGYIISTGLPSESTAPHFDVIIYDRLEAPILWVEENQDASDQGKSRAIPVEYVCAVLEVKSTFTTQNVNSAIKHLGELSPLMSDIDGPEKPYKLHLPKNFCCGVLFIELKKKDAHKIKALMSIVEGRNLRRFFGAVVLRGETHSQPYTCRIQLATSATPQVVGKNPNQLLGGWLSDTVRVEDGTHMCAVSIWLESAFAQFAFDLIAMMQGKYDVRRVSSFYGMG